MLYSFGRMKIVSRNRTKSAVATAAYHSAGKMKNEWDGVTHDYRHKTNVVGSYIRLPENAPGKYTDESVPVKDRLQLLWNDVELNEKNCNAQLARQNYLALQDEFTLEQNLECVERFIQENCTSIGMGVTYSVHLKPGNQHVDLMYLMREFDKNGNFRAKTQKQYLCRRSGEERWLDAATFKKLKIAGWEKVYKFSNGQEEKRLTPTESELYPEFERISKYPVDRKEDVNTWNQKDLTKKWRKSWEVILNEKFEELGFECRVDCRSYKEQGIKKIPTLHVGNGPDREERQLMNDRITALNDDLSKVANIAIDSIIELDEIAETLENEPQSADDVEYYTEQMRYHTGVLEVIIDSDHLDDDLKGYIKLKMDDLRLAIINLIQEFRMLLKMDERANFAPRKPSLDDIIKGGAEKIGTVSGGVNQRAKNRQNKHDER